VTKKGGVQKGKMIKSRVKQAASTLKTRSVLKVRICEFYQQESFIKSHRLPDFSMRSRKKLKSFLRKKRDNAPPTAFFRRGLLAFQPLTVC
jgi:hypothetical protein